MGIWGSIGEGRRPRGVGDRWSRDGEREVRLRELELEDKRSGLLACDREDGRMAREEVSLLLRRSLQS